MIYNLLKSRKLSVIVLFAFLPLIVIEAGTRNISGYVFIGFAAPLAVNLVLCLYEHIKKIQKLTLEKIGFLLFHSALLVIMTGGIITYLTYTMGYIDIVEGRGFTDKKIYYTGWKQKFGSRSGTGINIYVKKIVLDFWENGQIKEFNNEILIEDGDKIIRDTINVNGSVKYGKLLINMARFYGLAPYFTFHMPYGDLNGHVTIRNEKKSNEFDIPLTGYTGFATYKNIKDKEITVTIQEDKKKVIERVMKKGDMIELGPGSLELTDINVWNGLTVVTDSGKWTTYTGFILFLTGLALFYGRKFFGSDTA